MKSLLLLWSLIVHFFTAESAIILICLTVFCIMKKFLQLEYNVKKKKKIQMCHICLHKSIFKERNSVIFSMIHSKIFYILCRIFKLEQTNLTEKKLLLKNFLLKVYFRFLIYKIGLITWIMKVLEKSQKYKHGFGFE